MDEYDLTTIRRQRCAVLVADVAGYTTLMERNEAETHARLAALRRAILNPAVAEHHGRIVKNTGDGFLVVFDEIKPATTCAIQIQQRILEIAARFPADDRILFRIGLNLCQAIIDDDDVFGEGVNIAARLMALAEPGDLILTAATAKAAAEICGPLPTFDTGDLFLKNMTRPIRAVGIRIASASRASAPKQLGGPDTRPSIAILPFRQIGKSGSENPTDGIVEEITFALSSLRDIFVVSRASTLNPALENRSLTEIGRELGVRYVLQGTIAADHDSIRVFTEIAEASTGQILFADRHEAPAGERRALEAEIAIAATKSIAPHMRGRELRNAMRKHPESLTTYDLVLQARQELYKLGPIAAARARSLLQQAIALDPDYALAHSYLAYWYTFHVGELMSSDPEKDALEAARSARIAIQLDERDALARAIYGYVQSFLFRDYEIAMSHFARAIEDGPNCAEAWSMSSLTMGFMGDGESAIERAQFGLRLSPLDSHLFAKQSALGQAHYIAGHYDPAISWARKAHDHNPTALFNERLLAASLAAAGRPLEARRIAESMMLKTPDFRLDIYRRRCPFRGEILDRWLGHLRQAGLPD